MARNYTLTDEQKKQFAGIYLLDYMINTPKAISIFLDGNDQDLEPILEWLMLKKYIEIKDQEKYIPTVMGREVLKRFMDRYSEYLTMFDIYCAVDLEAGEFAFSSYFEYDDEQAWKKYLNEPHWEDLRIAVARFKNMDAVEIVFMSFINEQRFGRDASGWQFDLLLGSVWDDILHICNTAIHEQDLAYEDEQGEVSGKDVLIDVITQGSEIMIDLLEQEAQIVEEKQKLNFDTNGEADAEYYVDEVTTPRYAPDYYYGYRDPFYISPAWMLLLFI
ncbi:MAG: hypothetical protein P8Y99_02445 [Calditrichaceae bacterium]